MTVERLWLGLARQGVELSFHSYARRPLTLSFDAASGWYANVERVDFGSAREDWLFIDGCVIAADLKSSAMATSQLIVPLFVRAGHFVMFEPGTISMRHRDILDLKGKGGFRLAS